MADNNTSTNTSQGGATAPTSQNTANTGTGERTFYQADVDRMIAELCAATDGLVLADVADGFLKKVENRKGSLLPTTGGIGTIVLYAAGGACIIGAGAYLVTRMRSGRKQ